MTEEKLATSDIADRGHKAKLLLEDELLQAAFTAVEDSAHRNWAKSLDAQTRDNCWWLLQAIKQVRGQLESHVKHGKIADAELEQAKE